MKRILTTGTVTLLVLGVGLAGAAPAAAEGSSSPDLTVGLHPSPHGGQLPTLSSEYKNSVDAALASSQDVWGQQVLAKPGGPTYDNVKDYLTPIMYAIAPAAQGGFLTDTGVYYIPMGQPQELTTPGDVALTVADGSQIISNRVGSSSTSIFVGTTGQEQFGSNLAKLSTPQLDKGYLPILELHYQDQDGIQYHQESLATDLPGTKQVASYVKITADRGNSGQKSTKIRFQVSNSGNLHQEGNRLVDDQGRTYMYFSPGATFTDSNLVYELNLGESQKSVYIVRLVTPTADAPAIHADEGGQERARMECEAYWENRLREGSLFDVPEERVMNAQRNLLIQDLLMTWRYSLGNAYEAFYQPESSDTVETLGRYGFTQVYRQALQDLLPMTKGANRRDWEIGEKLFHAADYYRLTGDPSLINANLSTYEGYAADLATQHANDPNHLLNKTQYSSDVHEDVYGLHQIGTALFGLSDMVSVWAQLGYNSLADTYAPVADDLRRSFQQAVQQSSVRLSDGSLFTPVMLLSGEQPYDNLTTTTLGSYWNLVAHYGFAAHVYEPGSPEAKGTLSYLYNHGSRLLGLLRVRDGALDDVYEVEQAKFLADNDQPDQLVLSLYSDLAHGMTRNTFITGESENVGPLATKWPKQFPGVSGWAPNEYYRGMYLSPNSANNSLFLTILRLMLINDTTDNAGVPQGLQLAFSTPRAWLDDGQTIRVKDAPTLFGPVSYTITSKIAHNQVMVDMQVPDRTLIGSLQLRLRVPGGKKLTGVTVNGRPYTKFNTNTETIDLTGLTGKLIIRAYYR